MSITPDTQKIHPGRYWLAVANDSDDPIQMAGAALCGLLELLTERDEADQKTDSDEALVNELDSELSEARQRLDAVRGIVAKSKAEWAGKIRAALGDDEAAPPVTGLQQPARDADVEEWRAYAHAINGTTDFSAMNRSQIRTALGLPNA